MNAVIAGALQGVTEFLPVSSSGHLVLWHRLSGFSVDDNVAFDVALHAATVLALIVYFRSDLWRYARAFIESVWRRRAQNPDALIAWLLLIGTIPAALLGFLAEDFLTNSFRNLLSVSVALGLVGFVMLVVEAVSRPHRAVPDLRVPDALVIGVAQASALIPGVSRSGATIIAGMGLGLHRRDAARFAFLLSVPIMLGTAAYKALDVSAISQADVVPLIISVVCAFFAGTWAIGFLLKVVGKVGLKPFAYYRIALAAVLLIITLRYG